MANCVKCGTELQEGSVFCQKRGTAVVAVQTAVPTGERVINLAGWGDRILAYIIDMILAGIVLGIIRAIVFLPSLAFLWYSLTYNGRIFLRIAMFIASPMITPYLLFTDVRHFIRGGLSFRQKVKERHFHELNEKLNTPPKEEIEDDEFSKMIRESMLITRRKCENWEER